MRLLAALAAAAVTGLAARPASATLVRYESSNCHTAVDVLTWAPKDGPVARYVADAFDRAREHVWIGLGRTDGAFWSAEGGPDNDADDFTYLDLVETRFDGRRTRHQVIREDVERFRERPGALHELVLRRLWRMANVSWPADRLVVDSIVLPGAAPPTDPYQGPEFVAFVASPQGALGYAFETKTSMCWCFFSWNAKPLTRP